MPRGNFVLRYANAVDVLIVKARKRRRHGSSAFVPPCRKMARHFFDQLRRTALSLPSRVVNVNARSVKRTTVNAIKRGFNVWPRVAASTVRITRIPMHRHHRWSKGGIAGLLIRMTYQQNQIVRVHLVRHPHYHHHQQQQQHRLRCRDGQQKSGRYQIVRGI
jgi:hypothetical protein